MCMITMPRAFFTVFTFLIVLLFPVTLFAIMIPLKTEQLTQDSGLIVSGTVDKVQSYWSKDKTFIFTRAVVTLKDLLKGDYLSSTIHIEYEGGSADGIFYHVSDSPQLRQGEEVILFLQQAKSKKFDDKVYRVYGFAQGKYSIVDGLAIKGGFGVVSGKTTGVGTKESKSRSSRKNNIVDSNLPVVDLLKMIKEYQKK